MSEKVRARVMPPKPPHIVIAGGGVAAVEAVAALRALAGPAAPHHAARPEDELTPRPASVALAVRLRPADPAPVRRPIQRHARFDLHRGTLARVEPDEHVAVDDHGEPIRYDKLLVAVGARAQPALPGAITFAGPADAAAVARALEDTARLAFVLPSASGWALPVYELAIMAAIELRNRGVEPEITVVTPEPAPLWVFGAEASARRRGAAGRARDRAAHRRAGPRRRTRRARADRRRPPCAPTA